MNKPIALNSKQIATVIEALNSHEGVLSTDYQQSGIGPAQQQHIAKQMQEVRELAYLLLNASKQAA